MKLAEVKNHLKNLKTISFQLPDGELVPGHFHVTEVGNVSKHFIDCGGVIRKEEVVNFQLWNANDYDHRLHPEKLVQIIELSEEKLNIDENLAVEVEYQGRSIETFTLEFDGSKFLLVNKQTDCLAKDQCGIPAEKPKLKMANLNSTNTCTPGGGCC
ncbi:DUF6428 family protein [Leeuwenhoekiella marinoflava]|uniref:Uncharacterized protein n=2 Tax=Leeuwenhoekiella marinoflava TaxID=988 RepID=A0A4Q0PKW8_9FLAO|nr:DUF6428 family protein [Leeuwenhoekiella marinoflava]RXG28438.1 hypothetical protein DSL99_2439 [Leeuwenhoekiella marinoflava]SHF51868.1 hypothetical protein SAMN02745246_02730 [Leeuwenhoekiella marinoflava DSM 3653]